jgi:hypothetical protein
MLKVLKSSVDEAVLILLTVNNNQDFEDNPKLDIKTTTRNAQRSKH